MIFAELFQQLNELDEPIPDTSGDLPPGFEGLPPGFGSLPPGLWAKIQGLGGRSRTRAKYGPSTAGELCRRCRHNWSRSMDKSSERCSPIRRLLGRRPDNWAGPLRRNQPNPGRQQGRMSDVVIARCEAEQPKPAEEETNVSPSDSRRRRRHPGPTPPKGGGPRPGAGDGSQGDPPGGTTVPAGRPVGCRRRDPSAIGRVGTHL